MEVQTHAPDVELVKAYWKKFFQEYSGRGLPKVIDEQVLLAALAQKVCSGEGDRNDGAMERFKRGATDAFCSACRLRPREAEVIVLHLGLGLGLLHASARKALRRPLSPPQGWLRGACRSLVVGY